MQYLVSFLEGVVTFISPCLLPMLPLYLTYFAGGGERKLSTTLKNTLGFVLGFTVVFMLLGALAGTFGSFLFSGAFPENSTHIALDFSPRFCSDWCFRWDGRPASARF